MKSRFERILATREAGDVLRCHTFPHIGEYSIGLHSWKIVSLLFELHPDPSVNLIKACLWHDNHERFLGDLPATAKWNNSYLDLEYSNAADEVERTYGWQSDLGLSEIRWLNALDKIELWLWAKEQPQTRHTASMIEAVEGWVEDHIVPEEILGLWEELNARNYPLGEWICNTSTT